MVLKRDFIFDHLVDGSPMLNPDVDVEITYEDIELGDSGYDASGYYHRFISRYGRRTWRFKYAILTKEEFVYLRSLFQEKKDFEFSYLDEEDYVLTVRAYCKPITVAYQSKRSGLYKNLTLEIIEC